MSTAQITLQGKSVTLLRLTLKGWTSLEGSKLEMDEAVKNKDFDKYYTAIVQFIELASSIPPKIDWNKVPWFETLSVYSQAVVLNSPTIKFPILASTKADNKKLPWEYSGRAWYFWLHLLASNYGWSEEVIGDLDIDTAIGLYQEILLSEQLEKEWTYSLSELAYPYNQATKKSNYKPLGRPEWMLPMAPKQLPVIKMRKDMMPIGNIVDLTEKPKDTGKRGI
jgi:hypothetical protein